MNLKKFKYPFLLATLALVALVVGLFQLGAVSGVAAMSLVFCGQLLILSRSKAQAALFNTILSPEQVREFSDTLENLKTATLARAKRVDLLEEHLLKQQTSLDQFRRQQLAAPAKRKGFSVAQPVSEECARFLGSLVIMAGNAQGKLDSLQSGHREGLLRAARGGLGLGIESRTALTSSDIPLPTNYASEVVELVWEFGQARQYGTVFPLTTGTTKLPRLKTSPAFGLIAQSASVTQKSPQTEWVTFTLAKWGGLILLPSEMMEDSIVPIGQWLAIYAAREMAKIEDTVYWVADGSGTYDSLKGATKAALDLGYKLTLGSTKTHASDITLDNLRALRAQVATAAHRNAAYYMNRTMEALLCTFNVSGNTPYLANGGTGNATLDGYPIRWVDVLPTYSTSANASQLQLLFGDASYHYLGAAPQMNFAISGDAFFEYDQIAVRALERFTTGLMADQALAVLQLAAA